MTHDQERLEFEKWFLGKFPGCESYLARILFDDYDENFVRQRWEAWQARAALQAAKREPVPPEAMAKDAVHPHVKFELTRSLAPSDLWHWVVKMPDGHIFSFAGGFESSSVAFMDAIDKAPDNIFSAESLLTTPRGG